MSCSKKLEPKVLEDEEINFPSPDSLIDNIEVNQKKSIFDSIWPWNQPAKAEDPKFQSSARLGLSDFPDYNPTPRHDIPDQPIDDDILSVPDPEDE